MCSSVAFCSLIHGFLPCFGHPAQANSQLSFSNLSCSQDSPSSEFNCTAYCSQQEPVCCSRQNLTRSGCCEHVDSLQVVACFINQCAAGALGTASTMPNHKPTPLVSSPQPKPFSRSAAVTAAAANQLPELNSSSMENASASHHQLSGELQSTRSGDCYNTMKDAESLCIVCFDVKPLCRCVPCGHIAICKACSQAVKEQTSACPICQQAIQSMQEVLSA